MAILILLSLAGVFAGWFLSRELAWFWTYAAICVVGLIGLAVVLHGSPHGYIAPFIYSLPAGIGAFIQCFRLIGFDMHESERA